MLLLHGRTPSLPKTGRLVDQSADISSKCTNATGECIEARPMPRDQEIKETFAFSSITNPSVGAFPDPRRATDSVSCAPWNDCAPDRCLDHLGPAGVIATSIAS